MLCIKKIRWSQFESTKWLHGVGSLLRDSIRVCDVLDNEGVSVLLHDSTGFGRSVQLSSLSQLMLDPYYRSMDGFCVLIEKEWFSFGHAFTATYDQGDETILGPRSGPSAFFVQWLDAVWQILQQFPLAFEFDELLLVELLEQCSMGQSGSFLFSTEIERQSAKAHNSVWALIFSEQRRSKYVNPFYSLNRFLINQTPQTLFGERALLASARRTTGSNIKSHVTENFSPYSKETPDISQNVEDSPVYLRLTPASSLPVLQFWAAGHLRAERPNSAQMQARDQFNAVLREYLKNISPRLKLAEEAAMNQAKLQNLQQANM